MTVKKGDRVQFIREYDEDYGEIGTITKLYDESGDMFLRFDDGHVALVYPQWVTLLEAERSE